MTAIARSWLGFAALGAGLIHLALAVSAPLLVAIAFGLVAAAELGWGVVAFTSQRLPSPRVAAVAALVPIAAWAVALALQLDVVVSLAAFPMLVASMLDLVIAVGIAFALRRRSDAARAEPGTSRSQRRGAHPAAMFAGALVVAAVTIPAVLATGAGGFGEHDGPAPSPTVPDVGGHTH